MNDAPPNEDSAVRILIVDDSRDDAELTAITLQDSGLTVDYRRVDTPDLIESALREFGPQLVLSDINIPGFSGYEAYALIKERDPRLPFVFLTGSLEPQTSLPQGIDGVFQKDDLSELPELIRQLIEG